MDIINKIYTKENELPKEYQILNLRMVINKELYEDKVITFDVFNRMQNLLISRMNKIIFNNKGGII